MKDLTTKYIDVNGILWKMYQGALISENPPHVDITLSDKEIKHLLHASSAWFIRWPSEWDKDKESLWWYVIKDAFGGLEELSGNTRSKVRRSFKRQDFRKVDPEIISEQAYDVYCEAFNSYKTHLKPLSENDFKHYVLSLDTEIWDFFAAFDKESNVMTAYSQNLVLNDAAEYKIIKLHPGYLRNYSSYGLIYRMNEYYLKEKELKYVNDGSRSIAHDTNIQDFLIKKMKFRKAYCRLNVRYRACLGFFIRLLYPFRKVFRSGKISVFKKLSVLLKQEEIRRKS
ncbi:MAG: hypothetical protein R6V32_08725 [Bacteroidales bacterium]